VLGLPPGSYALFLRIDADPSNPEYYPGDLGGDTRFDVSDGEKVAFITRHGPRHSRGWHVGFRVGR